MLRALLICSGYAHCLTYSGLSLLPRTTLPLAPTILLTEMVNFCSAASPAEHSWAPA